MLYSFFFVCPQITILVCGKILPHKDSFVTLRQSTSKMNFFVFLRLGMIKTKKEDPALSKQSKIMIFECEVKFYLTHKMNPYNCLFVGQVMSPHHPDQMSQGWQVSGVTLLLCFSKGRSLSEWVSESVTRSPIELLWTAKKGNGRRNFFQNDIPRISSLYHRRKAVMNVLQITNSLPWQSFGISSTTMLYIL